MRPGLFDWKATEKNFRSFVFMSVNRQVILSTHYKLHFSVLPTTPNSWDSKKDTFLVPEYGETSPLLSFRDSAHYLFTLFNEISQFILHYHAYTTTISTNQYLWKITEKFHVSPRDWHLQGHEATYGKYRTTSFVFFYTSQNFCWGRQERKVKVVMFTPLHSWLHKYTWNNWGESRTSTSNPSLSLDNCHVLMKYSRFSCRHWTQWHSFIPVRHCVLLSQLYRIIILSICFPSGAFRATHTSTSSSASSPSCSPPFPRRPQICLLHVTIRPTSAIL